MVGCGITVIVLGLVSTGSGAAASGAAHRGLTRRRPGRAPVSTSAAAFAPRRSDRARGREATVLGYSGRTATVSV
jgi:hypothetical protein